MRSLLPFLVAALLLVAFAPAAGAHHGEDVGCDHDDDLYNHCHVGEYYWVTGPGCAGVHVGSPARCNPILDRA